VYGTVVYGTVVYGTVVYGTVCHFLHTDPRRNFIYLFIYYYKWQPDIHIYKQ